MRNKKDPSLKLEISIKKTNSRGIGTEPLPTEEIIDNRYLIKEAIGEGSYGRVYKAWDRKNKKFVAFKQLTVDYQKAEKRLQKEWDAMEHSAPNILSLLDHGNDNSYFITELATGGNLKQYIKREGPVTMEKAYTWIISLARSLAVLHNNGIYHGTITAQDILIGEQGELYLTNFGRDRIDDKRKIYLGNYDYASPEQLLGQREKITGKTDTWALAVIFYFIISGKMPFPGSIKRDIQNKVLNAQPDFSLTENDKVKQLLTKALAREQKQRYDAEKLACSLEALFHGKDLPFSGSKKGSFKTVLYLTLCIALAIIIWLIYRGL